MTDMAIAPVGPVTDERRVVAMDVARGLALLGIFCVNIECFGGVFAELVEHRPPTGPVWDVVAHYFVTVFCQGKFYTLFSMLFGMGLVLQRSRAKEAGRNFKAMYLRRLAMLMLIGLCHALLLWYGDILFFYSLAGLILFFCSGFRARTMAIVAGVILTVSTLLGTGFMLLTMSGQASAAVEPAAENTPVEGSTVGETAEASKGADASEPASEAPQAKTYKEDWGGFEKTPAGRVMADLKNWESGSIIRQETELKGKPMFDAPFWRAAEAEAFHDGPYSQAFAFRAMIWLFILVFTILGFGWSILAMFFLGGAIGKWNLLGREHGKWHRRFVMIGLLVGLPANIGIAVIATYFSENLGALALMGLLSFVGQPALALGYMGLTAMMTYSGGFTTLKTLLSNTGRMALTNYLTQTVISTFVFYHWGLKQFGEWSHAAELGFVFAVYVCQMFASTLWLKKFRFGPVEWLWRSATYWEWQGMRR